MKNWIQNYLPITFEAKLFIFLVIGFFVATVAGTMSFVLGYFLAGKLQGHDVIINYCGAYCKDELPQSFLFSSSGVLTPILIGIAGLIILFLRRKNFTEAPLSFPQWMLVFASLFLLRQLDNFSFAILRFLATGNFRCRNADTYVSELLNLPSQFIQVLMVIVGIITLAIIVFRFIPKTQRFTFLLSGIVGGVGGYYLWFLQLGKIILP